MAAFHLLHRPSTLRKLRDELFAAIPDPNEVVPLAKLESLPYLRAVVKEAFRHNIGTSGRLPRIAPHETLTCRDRKSGKEWSLSPGTVVSMSPFHTVMSESEFADALGFHPERWLGVKNGEGLDRRLHIFGGGTRVCLGMALAQAELYLLLARLFRRWGSGGTVGVNDDGDRRAGDLGVLRIYQSTPQDCQMAADYFVPIPYKVGVERAADFTGAALTRRAGQQGAAIRARGRLSRQGHEAGRGYNGAAGRWGGGGGRLACCCRAAGGSPRGSGFAPVRGAGLAIGSWPTADNSGGRGWREVHFADRDKGAGIRATRRRLY